MFADRAAQFAGRLGWDVTVDAAGAERDQYDALEPVYLVWERRDGSHGGSMRFLPTVGRTMLDEHFGHIAGDHRPSWQTWECTRFCLAPDAGRSIGAALLAGAMQMGLGLGLRHCVGVFDAPMLRVYRRAGWAPELLGRQDGICAGRWSFDPALRPALLERAGLSGAVAGYWFDRAFRHGEGLRNVA